MGKSFNKKIIFAIILVFVVALPMVVQAKELSFKPAVEIPGMDRLFSKGADGSYAIDPLSIANYIKLVFKFSVGIAGIVAALAMMLGGFQYVMAGGNPDSVNKAKSMVWSAISGLILLSVTWLVLATIDIRLVELTAIKTPESDLLNKTGGDGCPAGFYSTGLSNVALTDSDETCNQLCGKQMPGSEVMGFYTTEDEKKIQCCRCELVTCFGIGTACSAWYSDGKQSGYCYDKKCYVGDGVSGEPCGDEEGSTCKPSSECETSDWGGRDCGSNLTCCKKE